MAIFTDAFTSGERDTIPFCIHWRGREWDEKKNAYKTVLTVQEALEETLENKPTLKQFWEKIKTKQTEICASYAYKEGERARIIHNFVNLCAANFYMLVIKEKCDVIFEWAKGDELFTKN